MWNNQCLLKKITLESVPGTNQYYAIRVKFLAQGNNGGFCWGSNSRMTDIHRLLVRRSTHCAMPHYYLVPKSFINVKFKSKCRWWHRYVPSALVPSALSLLISRQYLLYFLAHTLVRVWSPTLLQCSSSYGHAVLSWQPFLSVTVAGESLALQLGSLVLKNETGIKINQPFKTLFPFSNKHHTSMQL